MLKKKCSSCGEKLERKFIYCPYCGFSFKKNDEEINFGMLGRDDSSDLNPIKMSFGMDKIMNSLVKQLEKQFNDIPGNNGSPRGFKIQISTGKPNVGNVPPVKRVAPIRVISEEEMGRRSGLKRVEASSNVRRLADRIIYEISTPGVISHKDVVFTKLEEGVEVKAYSEDKCYVKVIPLNVEIMGCSVRDDAVFVELKS